MTVKRGGRVGIAQLAVSPTTMQPTAKAAERATPANGLDVHRWAAPAGAARRPSRSRAPTAWVASAAVAPSSARKRTPRPVTGRPRAAATAGSMLEKINGRVIARTTTTRTRATTAVSRAAPWLRPKTEPKRTLTPAPPLLAAAAPEV